jgi:hypothetical protein
VKTRKGQSNNQTLRLIKKLRRVSLISVLITLSIPIFACNRTLNNPKELEQIPLPPTKTLMQETSEWWRPVPGLTWQWQLTDLPVDTSVDADVYDLDLFNTSQLVQERIGIQTLNNSQLWCLVMKMMAGQEKGGSIFGKSISWLQ